LDHPIDKAHQTDVEALFSNIMSASPYTPPGSSPLVTGLQKIVPALAHAREFWNLFGTKNPTALANRTFAQKIQTQIQ
jgi:hypothetical protein